MISGLADYIFIGAICCVIGVIGLYFFGLFLIDFKKELKQEIDDLFEEL